MSVLLVVEDGDEYAAFARAFLSGWDVSAARTAREALALARTGPVDALLLDLRFDRTPLGELVGDVAATATRLFGGDLARAERHVRDQQGALVLAALREAGAMQRAVFIHEFDARRLANLRKLYGDVHAVARFDAAAIEAVLRGQTP